MNLKTLGCCSLIKCPRGITWLYTEFGTKIKHMEHFKGVLAGNFFDVEKILWDVTFTLIF